MAEPKAGKIIIEIDVDAEGVMRVTKEVADKLRRTGESAKKAGGGMKEFQRQAGNMGNQLQDMIVQLQMGTDKFKVFGQQVPQMFAGMQGAGPVIGTVIALGAAVGGYFYNKAHAGANATKDYTAAIKYLDDVMAESGNGLMVYSDKYAELIRKNGQLAKLMKDQAELKLDKAIREAGEAAKDASKNVFTFGDQVVAGLGGAMVTAKDFNTTLKFLNVTANDYATAQKQAWANGPEYNTQILTMTGSVEAFAQKMGVGTDKAYQFLRQVSDVSNKAKPTQQDFISLGQAVKDLNVTTDEGKDFQEKFGGALVDNAVKILELVGKLDQLKRSQDAVTQSQANVMEQSQRELTLSKLTGEALARKQAHYKALDAQIPEGDARITQLEDEAAAVWKNHEAQTQVKKDTAAAASAAKAEAKRVQKAREKDLDALEKLRQEGDLTTESIEKRKIQQAGETAAAKLSTEATKEQIAEAKRLGEQNYKVGQAMEARKKAEEGYKGLQAAASPVAAVDLDYSKQMETYAAWVAFKGGKDAEMEATGQALFEQYQKKRQEARWQEYTQQDQIHQMLGASIEAFQSGATDAITGLINGTQTLEESFANIGSTILNSVVSSLVQMGIEWVKNMIMADTMAATSTATQTAMASSMAAAWAPAAMAASIASYGAAAAAGSTAYTTAMAAAQVMAAVPRKNGGPVNSSGLYQVGEGNKPEIFKAGNGNQYMIPGQGGRVISNKDLGGGAGGITQNVTFNIQTTGGIDDATMQRMTQMMRQVSLTTIKDQQRPGGQLARSR